MLSTYGLFTITVYVTGLSSTPEESLRYITTVTVCTVPAVHLIPSTLFVPLGIAVMSVGSSSEAAAHRSGSFAVTDSLLRVKVGRCRGVTWP